ncbi:MAG: 50S ribosomal protein L19e [Candidatus Aenigmarchaeota archaeon]|nr:50S ribosomal protein L19e [Candidatus Aenigmarchaeota archaeon]
MSLQRRLASRILDCGESRVWIDPAAAVKVAQAITRSDIRGLIAAGSIKRIKEKTTKHKVHRKQGAGSRKGTKKARTGNKTNWLKIVRPQRALLHGLRSEKKVGKEYRKIYLMIKGNSFRSKAHLMNYLKEKKILKE